MPDWRQIPLLASFFLLQLMVAFFYVNPVDVMLQYFAARDIANGLLLYRDITQAVLDGKLLPYPSYPPVYLGFLAFLFKVFGTSLVILKLNILVSNTIAAYFIRELALRYNNNENIALVAMICFIVNPITWTMTIAGFFDNFAIMLMLGGLIAFFDGYWKISGLMIALASWSKLFPILLLVAIIPVFVNKRAWHELSAFMVSFLITTLIIISPFILLCPDRFIYEVFFHLGRENTSMSLFFYFLPEFAICALLLQVVFLSIMFKHVYSKIEWHSITNIDTTENHFVIQLFWIIQIIILGFFALNRIVYPHYVPWITVFFSILVCELYHHKTKIYARFYHRTLEIPLWSLYFISYSFTGIAAFLYSVIWILEPDIAVETFSTKLGYWITAYCYNCGMFIYLALSILAYKIISINLKRDETKADTVST